MNTITTSIQDILSANPTLTRFIIGAIIILALLNIGTNSHSRNSYYAGVPYYRRKSIIGYIIGLIILGGLILFFIRYPEQLNVWFIRLIDWIGRATDWVANVIENILRRS